MQRCSFAKMECPIARAVEQVGDGWTLLILRESYKGARTFGDFQAQLPIAPTTLSRRLEALHSRGFFDRHAYQSNPPRDRYEPTGKALELLPVLLALGAWGNRWLAPRGAPLSIIDAGSGRELDLAVVDRVTRTPVVPGRVALRAWPGASRRLRAALQRPLVLGAGSAP